MDRIIRASYALERLCRRRQGIAFCLILALAFLGRLYGLADRPLWNDEAFSLLAASDTLKDTWSTLTGDVHPPLYYLLLNLYLDLGVGLGLGEGEFAARSLSAIAGGLSVAVVYAIARRFLSPFAALAAMALAAVHPLLFSWSQIARGYALFTLAGLVASWGAIVLIQALSNKTAPGGAESRRPWLPMAAFVGGSAAALWINNLFVIGLAAFSGAWLSIWLIMTPRDRRPLIQWAGLNAATVVIWLPWLPYLLDQSGSLDRGHFQVGWASVADGTLSLIGSEHLWSIRSLFGGLIGIGLVVGIASISHRGWRHQAPLLLVSLLPILLCIALFAIGEPAFGYAIGRLMWLSGLFVIFIAGALSAPPYAAKAWAPFSKPLRRQIRPISGVLIGAVVAGMLYASWNSTAVEFPAHNRIAQRIAKQAQASDALVLPRSVPVSAAQRTEGTAPRYALHYYWQRTGKTSVESIYPIGLETESLVTVLCRYRRVWFTRIPGDRENSLANRLIALGANHEQFSVAKAFYIGALEAFTLDNHANRCAI